MHLASPAIHWSARARIPLLYGHEAAKNRRGCRNAFAFDRARFSGVAAALLLSRHPTGQRNDGLALASPHLRHHVDRLALLFQSSTDARDEKVRPQAAHQDLPGVDAWGD